MPVIRSNRSYSPIGHRRIRAYLTRSTNQLRLGTANYRAAGCNIAWTSIGLVSSWQSTGDLVYLTRWQVDDRYASAVAIGSDIIRPYSLMPTIGHAKAIFPTVGGAINETAALTHDYAIARAADYGLRMIIPLCDPWELAAVGGISQWSTALGGNGSDFFTSATVITGFKNHVATYLNRVNTLNSLRYGDDPTICIIETGNEINAPDAWIDEMAAHIATLAPNALFKDGNDLQAVSANSIAEGYLVGNHYYQGSHNFTVAQLEADLATANLGDTVWFTEEFDWNNQRGGEDFVSLFGPALLANKAAYPLVLWWNSTGHDTDYGWAPDTNQYAGPPQDGGSYDVLIGNGPNAPGAPDNQSKVEYIRGFHSDFTDEAQHPWPVPGVPKAVEVAGDLAWRGVAGASSYTVERSAHATTGFAAIEFGLLDEDTPWTIPGAGYYRVRAVNADGVHGKPSNIVDLT